jgi:uncharacterized membrane protein
MRKWYPWVLVVLAFAFSAMMYSRLPAEIPSHWDRNGQINGYMSRSTGAWLMPIVLLAMAIILPRLPAIDPRRANYEKFRPSYDLIVNAVMSLVAVLHGAMLGAGAGWPVSMERLTPLLIGLLFVVIGNVLPRARPNWFFGIRTPWTLTNDRVWERTHRLGGVTFVIAGALLVVSAFLARSALVPVLIACIVVASIVPVVYSYFAWRKEAGSVHNS